MGRLVSLVRGDQRDPLDLLDHREKEDQLEKEAHKELQAKGARLDLLDLRVLVESVDPVVRQEAGDQWDLQDHWDQQDLLEKLEKLEKLGFQERLASEDHKAQLDLRERGVAQAVLDPLAEQVLVVPLVLQENKDNGEKPENQEGLLLMVSQAHQVETLRTI